MAVSPLYDSPCFKFVFQTFHDRSISDLQISKADQVSRKRHVGKICAFRLTLAEHAEHFHADQREIQPSKSRLFNKELGCDIFDCKGPGSDAHPGVVAIS